jgi:hypothetical protein
MISKFGDLVEPNSLLDVDVLLVDNLGQLLAVDLFIVSTLIVSHRQYWAFK